MCFLRQMQPGLPHERGSAQQRPKQKTRHGVHPLFEVRGGMPEKGVKAVIEKRKRVRPLARRTRDFYVLFYPSPINAMEMVLYPSPFSSAR